MTIEVISNAWTGNEPARGVIEQAARWAFRQRLEYAPRLLAPRPSDPRNWKDPKVGWGVVLADKAEIPAPLAELIKRRSAPVFRYIRGGPYEFILLRNYAAGKDIDINGAPHGTAPDALPRYLLIYGGPEQVPWKLQYVLNASRYVGRLHLTGQGLENYVNAVLNDRWGEGADGGATSDPSRVLLWSVVSDVDDITALMRDAIADKLVQEFKADDQIGERARFLDGRISSPGVADLASALSQDRPGLVITTSHGMTGPLDNPVTMADKLGMPVDGAGAPVTPESLIGNWQPAGAIWYAHACCSAGSDARSTFADLFAPTSPVGKVLSAVAGLGARVAPLPTALLGAKQPLRAFIGHVEPTFDWTIRQPATGQFLTDTIIKALYENLYVRKGDIEHPIGLAFSGWYGGTNGLRSQYDHAVREFNLGEDREGILLALKLAARDVESTVILGDPTVAMPGLA